MADVNVTAKKPWGLIKPESGELEIRIGKHGAYKVEDETGAEDAVTGRIYVLKLDIEQTAVGNDSKPNSLTLKLTSDSAPGGTAQWSSQPAGISGNGNNVTFNPKKLAPGKYTVTVRSGIVPGYFDTCTVQINEAGSDDNEEDQGDDDDDQGKGRRKGA